MEWGALTLAEHKLNSLAPPMRTREDDFVQYRFQKHRMIFNTNWCLEGLLEVDHWRTIAFGNLDAWDLAGLNMALENAQEFGGWASNGCLHPSPNLWIYPQDCAGEH